MSTKLKLRVETVSERVLRQVRTGKLDEARLLPAADKRTRDVNKRLDKLASRQGWYVFVSVRGRSGVCDGDRQGSLRRSPAGAETSSSSRWTGSRSSTGGTTPTARVEACPDVANDGGSRPGVHPDGLVTVVSVLLDHCPEHHTGPPLTLRAFRVPHHHTTDVQFSGRTGSCLLRSRRSSA